MVSKFIIDQFLSKNKQLTLLNGKRPIVKNWTNTKILKSSILDHRGNLGWVIGGSDLVVDIDPKNGGVESYKKLVKFLKSKDSSFKFSPTVRTPSGGVHIYLYIGNKYTGEILKKTFKDYPGIDFLTKGSQCVIPGSSTEVGKYSWYDDTFGGFEQIKAPEVLVNLLIKNTSNDLSVNKNSLLGDFEGLIGNNSTPEDKVIDYINKLNPNLPNDDWVKVGMALHDWHPLHGLKLWENWSKSGDTYLEGETTKRWQSFDTNGGVTLGTIRYMFKEVIFDESLQKLNQILNTIKSVDIKEIEFNLIPKIKKLEFTDRHREQIAKQLQIRYKILTSVQFPISQMRDMIAKETLKGDVIIDEAPNWCKKWIYVNTHTGFIRLKTLKLHKSESFNIENGKYIPESENGTKPSATKFISDKGYIDKVETICYLPSINKTIVTIDGAKVLNTFNPKSIPKQAVEFNKDGLDAISKVKKHIKFICSTNDNSKIFLQWLAFQVQFPGTKILWSPVIQSIQGVGKSFFGELLRSCLGDNNVGTISPTQVKSDFNGWATNVIVNVLEELKVSGKNRYEAVNALKPLITDRMIQINEKGVKQYMTYNTTNYICFTNYKDALPLEIDDRRWFIIFVKITSLDDLKNYVGEGAQSYFPKLFDAVRSNGPQLRKWLLEYPITEEFLNTKQAPMTNYKLSMIATEEASIDGLYDLKTLIKKGGIFYNETCLSSSDLFKDFSVNCNFDFELTSKKKHLLLKKLGYSLLPNLVKIDGSPKRIWTKGVFTNSEIRSVFKNKVTNNDKF